MPDRTQTLAPTERQMYDALMQAAAVAGWLVHHQWLAIHSPAGWPDLFCVHPDRGVALAFELKSQRGTIRPAQRVWLDALPRAGIPAYIVRPTPGPGEISLDEALRLLAEGAAS